MKKTVLSEEEKNRIKTIIASKTLAEDRPMEEVIKRDYNGNLDSYLIRLANFHRISLR